MLHAAVHAPPSVVAAGAAELSVATRTDPAAVRDTERRRAAADDVVYADVGACPGAGSCQPRRRHGVRYEARRMFR